MKKIFSRIVSPRPDPREAVRPLWERVVSLSRERDYYAQYGAADTLAGRFDMITAILALVVLRMESSAALVPQSAYLTELFIEDMDGQVRQIGVGDLMVGKQIGKLIGSLGGRIGAYRDALTPDSDAAADLQAAEGDPLQLAVQRNITLLEGADGAAMAAALRRLAERLARTEDAALLRGEIAE